MCQLNHVPGQILNIGELSIGIYESEVELAESAAYLAKDYLKTVIKEKGKANVILATGSSQIKFLEALTGMEDLNWSNITLFHLDEYLLSLKSDRFPN